MPHPAPASTRHPVAETLVEAWNAHDVDAVVALHAADFEGADVSEARPLQGRGDVRRVMTGYLRAFPDLQITVEHLLHQDGAVALVWTARGTHQGTLLHIPPTGRQVEVQGMTLLETSSDLIRRSTAIWDVAGLLRTLGLLPELYSEA